MSASAQMGERAAERGPTRAEAGAARTRARVVTLLRILLFIVICVAWEVMAARGIIDPFFVSRPSAIATRALDWIRSGTIFIDTAVTLLEASVGFVLAAIVGVAAGIALARYPLADDVLRPYIDVVNSIPRIALAPIFVLWFGLAIKAKIALVFSVAVFSFLINAYAGAKSVDPEYVRLARSLGATRRQVMGKILLPSMTPWLLAGARLGVAYSLSAAVVGEIVSANLGLGFRIGYAAGLLDTAGQFAALFVLALVAWVANAGVERIEKRLLRWKTIQDRMERNV